MNTHYLFLIQVLHLVSPSLIFIHGWTLDSVRLDLLSIVKDDAYKKLLY